MCSYDLNRTLLFNELIDVSTAILNETYEGFDIANSGGPWSECAALMRHANVTERRRGVICWRLTALLRWVERTIYR